MTLRRAARTDANKAPVVNALRAAGFSVFDLREPADLLVGGSGVTLVVEIKDGDKSPSKRRLTKQQREFRETWRGSPLIVVFDGRDAVEKVTDAIHSHSRPVGL